LQHLSRGARRERGLHPARRAHALPAGAPRVRLRSTRPTRPSCRVPGRAPNVWLGGAADKRPSAFEMLPG